MHVKVALNCQTHGYMNANTQISLSHGSLVSVCILPFIYFNRIKNIIKQIHLSVVRIYLAI